MELFVLDTDGDTDLLNIRSKNKLKRSLIDENNKNNTNECEDADLPDKIEEESEVPPERQKLLTFLKDALSTYPSASETKSKKKKTTSELLSSDDEGNFLRPNLDALKKNALKAIEKKQAIEQPSARQLAKRKKAERAKTKGSNWYHMPAPEITEELENDLKVLQMRSALDPKHFYKRNSMKTLPKYFQIGTVQHSAIDYFSERGERRNKKRTLVDELLADSEFQTYNKRKYKEIMEKRRKTGYYKANQKMKKLKKKKK